MVILTRQQAFFASGLMRGAAVLAGTGLLLMGSVPAAAQSPPALAPVQRAACPLQPTLSVAGRKDGQFSLQTDLASMTASNMASFIVLGKEAAAAGRSRDAEVAFLMACRLAGKLKGADAVESANAKYQLAWLYARLALEDGAGASAQRAGLRRRAEGLYADSLRTYQARLGPSHEKTRFAAEGLAALQPRSPGPENTAKPSQAAVPRSQPRPQAAVVLAPRDVSAPSPAGPSFDCAKARSVPEKMICSDAELARLDRELGRVYAQAKNAAADSAAFRRQNSEEWRRREATCRDRECLLRWYGNRYDQLMQVIDGPQTTFPVLR
jgi:uncharacterized protein YecT (DUF1311 family)